MAPQREKPPLKNGIDASIPFPRSRPRLLERFLGRDNSQPLPRASTDCTAPVSGQEQVAFAPKKPASNQPRSTPSMSSSTPASNSYNKFSPQPPSYMPSSPPFRRQISRSSQDKALEEERSRPSQCSDNFEIEDSCESDRDNTNNAHLGPNPSNKRKRTPSSDQPVVKRGATAEGRSRAGPKHPHGRPELDGNRQSVDRGVPFRAHLRSWKIIESDWPSDSDTSSQAHGSKPSALNAESDKETLSRRNRTQHHKGASGTADHELQANNVKENGELDQPFNREVRDGRGARLVTLGRKNDGVKGRALSGEEDDETTRSEDREQAGKTTESGTDDDKESLYFGDIPHDLDEGEDESVEGDMPLKVDTGPGVGALRVGVNGAAEGDRNTTRVGAFNIQTSLDLPAPEPPKQIGKRTPVRRRKGRAKISQRYNASGRRRY